MSGTRAGDGVEVSDLDVLVAASRAEGAAVAAKLAAAGRLCVKYRV